MNYEIVSQSIPECMLSNISELIYKMELTENEKLANPWRCGTAKQERQKIEHSIICTTNRTMMNGHPFNSQLLNLVENVSFPKMKEKLQNKAYNAKYRIFDITGIIQF